MLDSPAFKKIPLPLAPPVLLLRQLPVKARMSSALDFLSRPALLPVKSKVPLRLPERRADDRIVFYPSSVADMPLKQPSRFFENCWNNVASRQQNKTAFSAAKAYTAFFNSSFGVLQLLNRRSKKLSYPAFEAGHLKTLRLPDPEKVDIDAIVRVFEQHKDTPLERLRDCVTDKVRIALDEAVADALGVDRLLPAQWRAWLAKEPTITGKLYEGNLPTSADKGMKT